MGFGTLLGAFFLVLLDFQVNPRMNYMLIAKPLAYFQDRWTVSKEDKVAGRDRLNFTE